MCSTHIFPCTCIYLHSGFESHQRLFIHMHVSGLKSTTLDHVYIQSIVGNNVYLAPLTVSIHLIVCGLPCLRIQNTKLEIHRSLMITQTTKTQKYTFWLYTATKLLNVVYVAPEGKNLLQICILGTCTLYISLVPSLLRGLGTKLVLSRKTREWA